MHIDLPGFARVDCRVGGLQAEGWEPEQLELFNALAPPRLIIAAEVFPWTASRKLHVHLAGIDVDLSRRLAKDSLRPLSRTRPVRPGAGSFVGDAVYLTPGLVVAGLLVPRSRYDDLRRSLSRAELDDNGRFTVL